MAMDIYGYVAGESYSYEDYYYDDDYYNDDYYNDY